MIDTFGLQPREIFLIAFTLLIGGLIFLDRKKVNRHFILFYRRTKRGLEYIDMVARAAPRFWNAYGWAGAFVGFFSIIGALAMIVYTFVLMFQTRSLEQGPSLVLPGTTSQPQFQAGVSFIPAEYWVIGIAILMFVHEMSHGIVARIEGFEINSVGWVVLGIIPGAFVEPKGENMLPGDNGESGPSSGAMWEQGNWKSRIKVLAAGSFANYVTAIVFILLSMGIVSAVSTDSGVLYNAEEGLPAANAGMDNGTLYQIDNITINDLSDLQRASDQLRVNQTVDVWTSEGNFTMITVEHPNKDTGYIGINVGQTTLVKEGYEEERGFLIWFTGLLSTIALLNFLIGLFNMLPIKPLDGGLIVETLITEFSTEDNLKYLHGFSTIEWVALMGTVVVSILFAGGGI